MEQPMHQLPPITQQQVLGAQGNPGLQRQTAQPEAQKPSVSPSPNHPPQARSGDTNSESKENTNVQHMLLHVPADAKPGQKVTFAAPNGVYYQVTVPDGAKPGTPFRVAVPAVNPMNQWTYFQRMAAQLQNAMPMLQQIALQNGNASGAQAGSVRSHIFRKVSIL